MNNVTRTEWVSLAIVIAVLSLYVIMQTTSPNLQQYIEKYRNLLTITNLTNENLYDFTSGVSNGDLIFFCGDTKGERTCRWCTNSMYSHVGMLFVEPDPNNNFETIVYVWEADVGQHSKRGPRVIKLIDKLKKYHGFPYFMWRRLQCSNNNRPTTASILKVIEMYKSYEFDDQMLSWWFANCDMLQPLFKSEFSMFCSELIAMTMQSPHIKMMDTYHKPSWYSPNTFSKYIIPGLHTNYVYSRREFVHFSAVKTDVPCTTFE